MINPKSGYLGERSIMLPPMIIDMEEKDTLVSGLYITDIGYYPHVTYHRVNRQQPIDQYVMVYCVNGSGWYCVDGKIYNVSRNQFFILPAGKPHAYEASEKEGWSIYWINFCGSNAEIFANCAREPHNINTTLNSRISERNNIFEEIFTTLEGGFSLENLRYASSVLYYYLASMCYLNQYREAIQKPKDQKLDIVEAAIHYMNENIENHITIDDVLKYVGYSYTHFSTLFKKQTGMTPVNYINKLKIKRACYLLTQTNMQVNQICHKVGISDSLYFSRLFSKVMGMSPTEYRTPATR